jgi:hypothetical protein
MFEHLLSVVANVHIEYLYVELTSQ